MPEYPFVKARWFHTGRQGKQPIWVVVHTAETNELASSAEGVARYFATTDRQASAHLIADSDGIVRSVLDRDTAFAAKGANNLGLHMEHAGRAKQTAAEWADVYSAAMLEISAVGVALWCREFNIPARFVDRQGLVAGEPGITTHAEVSAAFPGSGHWDPGPAFPMTHYLALVRAHLHPPEDDDMLQTVQCKGDARLFAQGADRPFHIPTSGAFWALVRIGKIPGGQKLVTLEGDEATGFLKLVA